MISRGRGTSFKQAVELGRVKLPIREKTSMSSSLIEADLEGSFEQLKRDWKEKSRYLSNTAQIAMLWPYQKIIGMGPAVVPLILLELEREPDHWFWALEAITGENPVSERARGKVREMAEMWIHWGRNKGLIPNEPE